MSSDRELKLGNIEGLDVDADDRTTGDGATTETAPVSERPVPTVVPDRSAPWMAATAFLLVLVLVLSVWFFRQLTGLQAVVDNRLSESTEQLGSLASQLSATDETVNQSADQMRTTLSTHDSEIRKLWDVSNKRNKGWIKKNQEEIAALKKQREALQKSVASLQKQFGELATQQQNLLATHNQLQMRIELQKETVGSLKNSVASQRRQLDTLNKLLPAMQSLARLDSGGGLANRLTEIDAAINAFDAYRRQVNIRLDRLDGGGQ